MKTHIFLVVFRAMRVSFATSTDLGKFCSALMDNGGVLITFGRALSTMHQVASAEGERRCIGWAVTDDGCLYHTGFTGYFNTDMFEKKTRCYSADKSGTP